MAGYVFFPAADARQDAIWDYTVKRWSEHQAKAYIIGLHEHLAVLARDVSLWRRLPSRLAVPPEVQDTVYCSLYRQHWLFFRKLPSGRIGVLTILHAAMDLPVRLREDLERMSRQE
jgi:plasmid stabilization system protein ParE